MIFYYRSKEGGSIQYINDLTDFFESLRGICLPKNISFNESCQGDLNITKVSVNESEVHMRTYITQVISIRASIIVCALKIYM